MLSDDIKKQTGGDSSTNLQAQSIVIHNGLTYRDAREIALDVYKENFFKLSSEASQLAIQRAEELTDRFLEKLKREPEASVQNLRDPGMQIALYSAQKEYARTGDVDLQNLLVDILVERSKSTARDIKQIVLDESLGTAPRLTPEQFDVLTLSWLLTRSKRNDIRDLQSLGNHIRSKILPFTDSLTESSSCYEHLQYLGCGHLVQVGGWGKLEQRLRNTYPGLFCKGVSSEVIQTELGAEDSKDMIIPSLHDPSLFQVCAMDTEVIEKQSKERGIAELIPQLKSVFDKSRMTESEVRTFLLANYPALENLFTIWEKTPLKQLTLTTVGYAIAQANYRRRTGEEVNLSIWVK